MTFKDNIAKLGRRIERALATESNKVYPLVTRDEIRAHAQLQAMVATAGVPVGVYFPARPIDKAVNPTQLEFEKGKVILEGAPSDVSLARRFDQLVGCAIDPEAGWVSAEKTSRLCAHAEDLKDVFSRLSARTPEGAVADRLEYAIENARVTQPLVTVRLGSGRPR